mmetsp:Transcript_3342/g.9574  ORF Transcript_3342/g.9574 Transcript_3342/m.9574 type:complete len:273 (-) Transcript_3342:4-822(-)
MRHTAAATRSSSQTPGTSTEMSPATRPGPRGAPIVAKRRTPAASAATTSPSCAIALRRFAVTAIAGSTPLHRWRQGIAPARAVPVATTVATRGTSCPGTTAAASTRTPSGDIGCAGAAGGPPAGPPPHRGHRRRRPRHGSAFVDSAQRFAEATAPLPSPRRRQRRAPTGWRPRPTPPWRRRPEVRTAQRERRRSSAAQRGLMPRRAPALPECRGAASTPPTQARRLPSLRQTATETALLALTVRRHIKVRRQHRRRMWPASSRAPRVARGGG